MSLSDTLLDLYKSDQYPLHMPGHKRCDMGILSDAYHIDITEIEGYDNLYDAQGILREAMDRAAQLYKCRTYYLVNGSTTGILTAIHAVTEHGDTILVANNCHRSVYAAAELRNLNVLSLAVGVITKDVAGAVDICALRSYLQELVNRDSLPKALVITSPNYDGIVSNVKEIADICHNYGIVLIVDEAHGAHFSLDSRLPKGAIENGADIIIHSTHKTLAAMTQTALLHVQGNLVDITKVEKFWHMFQTSSPSYVLMASIDDALKDINDNGKELWDSFFEKKERFLKSCENLRVFKSRGEGEVAKCGDISGLDPCKITVFTGGVIDGYVLQDKLLRDYNIQLELASRDRIIAIVTYADSEEGFVRFARALCEIDDELVGGVDISSKVQSQKAKASNEKKELYAPCIPIQ